MLDTEKIRTLREGKGWSFADAAEKAGFNSRQQWYNLESGQSANPTLQTIEAVAKALGVKAKDLLK